jgi:hypothetical protein
MKETFGGGSPDDELWKMGRHYRIRRKVFN